ncbi:GGDEF domain-containing protein, partial [Candidatus Izimaplasma bacterium]|nr:GGDEF domain-containing protein [Candidatus Izimaplasma bacterium]
IIVYTKGLNKSVHIGSLLFYYITITSMLFFLGAAHSLGIIFLLLLSMVTIVTLDGKTQWSLLLLMIFSFVGMSISQIIADSNDVTVFTIAGFLGITLTIIGILFILSQNKHFTMELLEKTKSLTKQDHLTKVKNNKALFEDIKLLNFDLSRYNYTYCLAFLDLDKFKDINDLYGHLVGDQALIKFVESIRGQIRETDDIYRVGGDEFIILFKESQKEDIRKKILGFDSLKFTVEDHEISVAFSFGLVQQTSPPKDLNDLVKDADELMYKNKHSQDE